MSFNYGALLQLISAKRVIEWLGYIMYSYNDDIEANLDMAQKPGLEGQAQAFENSSRALKP